MCRMLAVVSREPIALDAAIAQEIEPFTEQSRLHADGWGVAWYSTPEVERALGDGGERPHRSADAAQSTVSSELAAAAEEAAGRAEELSDAVAEDLPDPLPVRRTPQIRRRIDPAWQDGAYREALAEAVGPMMLVHLRKASPGLPLQLSNTHPFRDGEIVFAHNGQFDLPDGLREAIFARGGRAPEGTTDSELLFSLIDAQLRDAAPSTATGSGRAPDTADAGSADAGSADAGSPDATSTDEVPAVDLATAVQRAAAELTALLLDLGARVPESLNCFLMTPDAVIAYQQSDPRQAKPYHEADNYTLRWNAEEERVIIATSGIPEDGWHELADGQAMIVRCEDRGVEIRPALA